MRRIAIVATMLAAMTLVPGPGSATSNGADRTTLFESAQARGVYTAVLVGGSSGGGVPTELLCQARAIGNIALYTAVTRCTLTFNDGVTIRGPLVRLPGVFAATGGVKLHKIIPYVVCVTGQVHYTSGSSQTDGFCASGGP